MPSEMPISIWNIVPKGKMVSRIGQIHIYSPLTTFASDLIDSYLNGPRTLSNDRLSYLIVSQSDFDDILLSPPPSPSVELESIDLDEDGSTSNYDILICATHFLGDGMALHQFANDFFGILGSSQNNAELVGTLEQEWETRWQNDDQLNVRVSFFSISGCPSFPPSSFILRDQTSEHNA